MKSFKDLREKTLTPAEKKKREEIAKAMERDNPGMDMRKKMAIATWQAKKVAEEAIEESITKMSSPRLKFHATKGVPHGSYTRKEVEDEHKRRMKTEPNYHFVKPSMNEEAEELDEISRDLARSYIRKATADNKERRSEVMKPFNSKDMDKNVSQYKKMKSREKGIETAGKKAYDIGGKAKVPARESVELDELNKSTLGSYIKKASGNMAGNAAVAAAQASSSMKKSSPDVKRNIKNRMTGIAKATDKLTKEEAEQIDEISKKTLGSYIKKAKDDLGNREAEVTRNRYVDPRGVTDPIKHNNALLMKRAKRRDNINKAVDKLTREQAEDDMPASPDEASMAMRQLDFIEDAAEKIKDSIKSGKGFPEWMQNKLSKLHGQMESLYSSLGEIEDEEEMDMDEGVQSADKKPEKYMRPDGKVGVRMVATDKKVVKND